MLGIAMSPLACRPAFIPPPPTTQWLAHSHDTQATLERGFIVHQNTCAKCHAFEDPSRHQALELSEKIMPKMAAKAKLNQADAKAVLAYLFAARKDS